MWPWPWMCEPGSGTWHINLWWLTILPYNFNIHQVITKLQSWHEKKTLFWHLACKCDLDLWGADLVLAQDTYNRVSAMLFQNPSRYDKVMEQTQLVTSRRTEIKRSKYLPPPLLLSTGVTGAIAGLTYPCSEHKNLTEEVYYTIMIKINQLLITSNLLNTCR